MDKGFQTHAMEHRPKKMKIQRVEEEECEEDINGEANEIMMDDLLEEGRDGNSKGMCTDTAKAETLEDHIKHYRYVFINLSKRKEL